MQTLALPLDSDGFQELAAAIWSQASPEGASTPDAPALLEVLASLLREAASGNGFIRLSRLKATPALIQGFARHPELFSVEDEFLMLPRYARHTHRIRAFFAARLAHRGERFSDAEVARHLDDLLPRQTVSDQTTGRLLFDNAQQRLAIAALVDAPVGVLTGGPGTGKTTTAAALLAVRRRLAPALSAENILVTAPTGKAACRIAEAIAKASSLLNGLSSEEQSFLCSIRSITLHRALEWGPLPAEKGGPFQRSAVRPLAASVVLVDEASMVDLSLMYALLNAIPDGASLYLLGDSDQLESVEVGGILSELVQRASLARHLEPALRDRLQGRLGMDAAEVQEHFEAGLPKLPPSKAEPLPGLVAGLRYSRRAMNAPWILDLAEVVKPGSQGSLGDFLRLFERPEDPAPGALGWHRENAESLRGTFCAGHWKRWADQAAGWTDLLDDSAAANVQKRRSAALSALGDFQLLCSTNAQVERANREGVALLQAQRVTGPSLPHGCPLIILTNQRSLGLSNGDVGIALGTALGQGALFALFPSGDGLSRLLPIAQLPAHQPAFGLTIHKSQGSEWKHIAIELPADPDSRLLTRNLLYTAITRSSRAVDLFGPEGLILRLLEG
jgi:exodeoxyribonuclease V alpha subunit